MIICKLYIMSYKFLLPGTLFIHNYIETFIYIYIHVNAPVNDQLRIFRL